MITEVHQDSQDSVLQEDCNCALEVMAMLSFIFLMWHRLIKWKSRVQMLRLVIE